MGSPVQHKPYACPISAFLGCLLPVCMPDSRLGLCDLAHIKNREIAPRISQYRCKIYRGFHLFKVPYKYTEVSTPLQQRKEVCFKARAGFADMAVELAAGPGPWSWPAGLVARLWAALLLGRSQPGQHGLRLCLQSED